MRLPPLRATAFFLSLLIAGGMLFAWASFEVTSTPRFCGSCHIMRPYYQSWKHSSHNQIACVDCHIPPGIKGELLKKYEALSMVVKYFTVTYGPKPWAEIEDASCLKCHDRRLISGKEVFRQLVFDHAPHLTEMRRGKKLRCTSCHSQIVQGSHIAVTTSTCILCHFKDRKPGEGTANCLLCHNVPEKTIVRENVEFNHADVKRFDMKCDWCHSSVVSGNGDVPKNRCYVCHNEPKRIEQYNDTEKIHQTHVTDRKIECLQCHNEIQHGIQREIQAIETGCSVCHGGGHSPQRSLYAGIGGKGVEPIPNPMYLAGIACEGCHFLPQEKAGDHIKTASAISCMACHGARFNGIYDRWRSVTSQRLGQAKLVLQQAEARLSEPYPQSFQDALANLELVENAVPIHNVDYSLALLNRSVELTNESLRKNGKATIPVPWTTVPFESKCLSCHQGIESQSGTFGNKPFQHFPHVIKNELDCELCHQQHEIPPRGKPEMLLDPSGCADCHHDTAFEKSCRKCHEADISATVKVRGKILDRQGLAFDHATHSELTGRTCAECHLEGGSFHRSPDPSRCAECHS